MVTGVSAAHALVMAAPNAAEHDAETVRRLAARAGAMTGNEVADWYQDATNDKLSMEAVARLDRILQGTEDKVGRE